MAQFRKDTHQYLPDGKTIFETVMLADQYGNIASGAGGSSIQLDADQLFSFQLERSSFAANNKGFAFTLAATGASNGDDAVGGITWEEIT